MRSACQRPIGPRRWLVLLALAAGGLGCDEEPPPRARPASPSLAPARPLEAPGAFDLVSTPDGALLAWVSPDAVLTLERLGPLGETRGSAREVVRQVTATEVAAAAGGGRVAVAWYAAAPAGDGPPTARVILGDVRGVSTGPPVDVGPVDVSPVDVSPVEAAGADVEAASGAQTPVRAARGSLALAASPSGVMDLLLRVGPGPCRDGIASSAPCEHLHHRRLGGSAGRPAIPLVLPRACDGPAVGPVVGNAFVAGSLYYAVCAREAGLPSTTLFALAFDPEYAHAERVLEGCVPHALVSAGDEVVLLGRCGSALHALTVGDTGRRILELGAVRRRVRCAEGRPRVDLTGTVDVATVRLDRPSGEVGGLFPGRFAPGTSRSVWTGEALLVADGSTGALSMARYQCRAGALSFAGRSGQASAGLGSGEDHR